MRRFRPPEDPESSGAAYARALRWLTARELSSGQLRSKLRERGFEATAIETAIERLRNQRLVDDRRTAEMLARTEARVRRHGPRRILAKLAAMEIDREIASEIVRDVFAQDGETELIERSIDRRLRHGSRDLRDADERRRMLAYLVRQGFSPSAAAAVLRRKSK